MTINMVRNSLARIWTLPTDADTTDDWADDGLDMDRWENDGGRSQGTIHGSGHD